MFQTLLNIFRTLIQSILAGEGFALVIGLLIGLVVILLIRAGQAWAFRGSYGYNTYQAVSTRRRLYIWAAIGAMMAFTLAGLYLWRTYSPQAKVFLVPTPDAPPAAEVETRILIPAIGIEAKVVFAEIVANQWDVSRLTDEVAHLEGTAFPGDQGNAVLAAHVTIPNAGFGPFKELDTLQLGDLIVVEREGIALQYEVVEILEVQPEDVEVAYPTSDTRLTLITCSNWDGNTKTYTGRIVVIARPVIPGS